MAQAVSSVKELVGMIERGEIRLPEMQRRYVWRATRVRDLLDSLYRGYPSGAILLWETDMEVPEREFAVAQQASPYSSNKLLLDGQQRLTSLSSVIRGEPIQVRGRKKPIDILFNLEHPDELTFATEVDEDADDDEDETGDETEDEIMQRMQQMTFVIATKKLSSQPHWISVTDIFKSNSDSTFLKKAGITDFEDPRYDKYVDRLQKLRGISDYKYRMDILERTLSYEEVTEIFVRVNSLGAKLRGSDLAMAQITAKWKDSLKEFEKFQDEFDKKGFDTEIGTFIRALVCFSTEQSRFRTVNALPVSRLQDGWKSAINGLEFSLNFLKSNVGIESIALLSSPYFLITVAAVGAKFGYSLNSEQESLLRMWVLAANAKGRYSRGSSESMLDQDLNAINKGAGIQGMLDNLKQQFGRIEISPEDLEGRNQRSGLFKTMYLLFKSKGAKDWETRLVIDLDHSGSQHKLQFHHIFPKAYLDKHYEGRQINDIANLAFIGGKTNRKISKKGPLEYFPVILQEQGQELFDHQCVPTESELLAREAFPAFLTERRKMIAQELNDFLFKP
jgi:hypothetical protein